MKRTLATAFLGLGSLAFFSAKSQTTQLSWSQRAGNTIMQAWPDSLVKESAHEARWTYDLGVMYEGLRGLWYNTGNGDYFKFIEKRMDFFVNNDGSIKTYKQDEYNIDNILLGRSVLTAFRVTDKEKYYKAVVNLREQLKSQPRTNDGGFWHKKRYPYQMWLDGLYMGEPFYVEYAAQFNDTAAFNDIAKQFILMEEHSRDSKTGLMYHGWDESKEQKWADKTTGRSPNFWARAMGWYGAALVDVLETFPINHPKRKALVDILTRYAAAIQKVQDAKTGLWWDVLDKPNVKPNYFEASASCQFVYTYAKAVRLGLLPQSYLSVAQKGYKGILAEFVKSDGKDGMTLDGTVSVSGLGGNPYRDGSFEYYMSEKVVRNDQKGLGAFLQMSNEMDIAAMPKPGKGKTVLLDSYFNNETKKDAAGITRPFHYKWEELRYEGFSIWGHTFKSAGASLATLNVAPTAANLKKANVYIVVDPDTKAEAPNPNYMDEASAQNIYNWVKNGGVLVMMMNDSANTEFAHFNILADKFGIHFNPDLRNHVIGNAIEPGIMTIPAGDKIFTNTKKVYLKDICTMTLKAPATAHFTNKGDVIMAVAKVGKGTVFAVGDPWLYNEYTDGRKHNDDINNYAAAKDLANRLLQQATAK
ncbi:glycoside hydrolase family 88 protein [Chitinophagaceae bacterium 26-R-25]|nr:glycoside hydrolase family 88 protein [Chitinophagaceae bacterium 26-R-25]